MSSPFMQPRAGGPMGGRPTGPRRITTATELRPIGDDANAAIDAAHAAFVDAMKAARDQLRASIEAVAAEQLDAQSLDASEWSLDLNQRAWVREADAEPAKSVTIRG